MIMETFFAKITAAWPMIAGGIIAAVFIGSLAQQVHSQQQDIDQLYNTQQQQINNIQLQLNQIQAEIQGLRK